MTIPTAKAIPPREKTESIHEDEGENQRNRQRDADEQRVPELAEGQKHNNHCKRRAECSRPNNVADGSVDVLRRIDVELEDGIRGKHAPVARVGENTENLLGHRADVAAVGGGRVDADRRTAVDDENLPRQRVGDGDVCDIGESDRHVAPFRNDDIADIVDGVDSAAIAHGEIALTLLQRPDRLR